MVMHPVYNVCPTPTIGYLGCNNSVKVFSMIIGYDRLPTIGRENNVIVGRDIAHMLQIYILNL